MTHVGDCPHHEGTEARRATEGGVAGLGALADREATFTMESHPVLRTRQDDEREWVFAAGAGHRRCDGRGRGGYATGGLGYWVNWP